MFDSDVFVIFLLWSCISPESRSYFRHNPVFFCHTANSRDNLFSVHHVLRMELLLHRDGFY